MEEGPSAVVTGAGGGIGAAIAARLRAAGYRVVVNDLNAEAVQETAARTGAFAIPGDAASADGAAELIAQAHGRLGPIDVWFGNAGIERGRGLEASDADWESSHAVNVMAHVRAARILVPEWIERGGGRFVLTASAAALLTLLDSPAYSASKHAALAFAEWLSATYRHRGIVVQAICPQGVETRMLQQAGRAKALLSIDPPLSPEAVADAVLQALDGERFLILPDPRAGDYYRHRALDTDRWLTGMNSLQQRLLET